MSPAWRAVALRIRPGGGKDFGRWVTPEELNVAPGLLGKPLARPSQRLMAMGVDLAAIGIVSSVSNFWWLAACVLGTVERARVSRKGPSPWRTVAAWALVALMAYAGMQETIETLRGDGNTNTDRAAATDDDEGDDEAIEALLAVPHAASAAAITAASVPALAASSIAAAASAAQSVTALQAHVRQLQRQLAKEREATESQNWRERLRRLGLDFGVGYGWSLVYFTMLPTWWRGQTLGKRLFGLRVIEITGKPMAPLLNFKRFGGYLAGMATGGLGLVQLLWDPNRQGLQDKAAHTVVIDERRPARPTAVVLAADPVAGPELEAPPTPAP